LNSPIGGFRKRGLDIVASLGGLVLFFPIFCMVGALIKAFDRGPILYSHTRIGYNGRPFGCLKFRTMVVDADKVLDNHLRTCPHAAREWAETRKLKSDPRVTRIGMVLRKTSIDELPQLINVLLGQMSLVGPRPIVPAELEKYAADAVFYVKVRPGLTGPWQVGGRNDTGYEIRVALDREYVENWTLRNDLILILRTIPVVLSASGSY
jgi:exopolysaccharide production protein ExoY